MPPLTVLYRVSNDEEKNTPGASSYNAFTFTPTSNSRSITLASIKKNCHALRSLSHLGPDGYHWRVRMEDSSGKSFSWWDIQDENANLPIKENMTLSQLESLFVEKEPKVTKESSSESSNNVSNEIKGALRSFGKAVNAVAKNLDLEDGGRNNNDRDDYNAPRTNVIAFKLLDLVKLQGGPPQRGSSFPKAQQQQRPKAAPAPRVAPPSRPVRPIRPVAAHSPPRRQNTAPVRAASSVSTTSRPVSAPIPSQQRPAVAQSLMDFSTHAPPPAAPVAPTLTRVEKLKKERDQKLNTTNRVWDDIDQRWVESIPDKTPQTVPTTKIKGISLCDTSNAIGKSQAVQQAVHQRVSELKKSQESALTELKEREEKKKQSEDEEDVVRRNLEPKVRQWSEEHGKKKQLRALLANLHLILWQGSGWKQVSLGDLLEEKKVRRCYLRATLKVHPDKTRELDAERRFLAKRIFDALSQAMTEFEDSK